MNYYKDYNILIRKLEEAEDRRAQIARNWQSIHYRRLDDILKVRYRGHLESRFGFEEEQ